MQQRAECVQQCKFHFTEYQPFYTTANTGAAMMQKVRMLLGLSLLQALNACSSVPNSINPDELYWNPKFISTKKCPDLTGKYLIPAERIYREFIPIPLAVDPLTIKRSGPLQQSDYLDVTLTINNIDNGLQFRGRTVEKEGEYTINFDGKYFGCANGEVIRRQKPFLTNGAESGICLSVAYSESHWSLNSNGDLVVTEVDRERCLSRRGDYLPDSDKTLPTRIYKRIP